MHLLLAFLAVAAQPFWEAKTPDQWTEAELRAMLEQSPWAQQIEGQDRRLAFFATAKPIEEARQEIERRARLRLKGRAADAAEQTAEANLDYTDYVREHRDESFVLAIPYPDNPAMGEESEWREFQKRTLMIVGKKKFPIEGYFPPTPSDPVLRIVFPRKVSTADKNVDFELYLPGMPFPERELVFRVKDLLYHGKLEM
jgi:hypothetical protein